MQISMIEDRLRSFQKSLRKQDRILFEELMNAARQNPQSGVMAAAPDPMQSILLTMIIDLKRDLHRLSEEVELLRGRQMRTDHETLSAYEPSE